MVGLFRGRGLVVGSMQGTGAHSPHSDSSPRGLLLGVAENRVDGGDGVCVERARVCLRFGERSTHRTARRGQEAMLKQRKCTYPQVLTVLPRSAATTSRLLLLVQQPVEGVSGRSETATTGEVVAVRNGGGRLAFRAQCAGGALKERDCGIGHRRSGTRPRRSPRPHR